MRIFGRIIIPFVIAALIVSCSDRSGIGKGRDFLEIGDLTRAASQFERAVNGNPRNAEAHFLLAKTYCLMDSLGPAAREYAILSRLDQQLADDTLLRQRLAVHLGMEPYPSVRLTDAAGNDAFPGISPDGQEVAFSSKRDGNTELYIMNSDGSGQRRLTRNKAVDYGPAFSPEGSKILFVSDRDGNDEIYLYDLASNKETRLTYNTGDDWLPCFSPDGQEMFWVSDRSDKYCIWRMPLSGTGSGKENGPAIFLECPGSEVAYFCLSPGEMLVQRETKNQGFLSKADLSNSRLTDMEFPSFRSGIPAVPAPDGKSIAYVSSRTGDDEIFLYDPEGKMSIRLTVSKGEDFVFGFSPDGRQMLYDSDRGGDRDVYMMQLDKLITREKLLSKITNL
jgi:dipeptidyl aminopeptidase/acylaminoacyl peptidase